jgi:hypothetical protein
VWLIHNRTKEYYCVSSVGHGTITENVETEKETPHFCFLPITTLDKDNFLRTSGINYEKGAVSKAYDLRDFLFTISIA